MLNPFYWYSLIWGVVLFLYGFGWSDLIVQTDEYLLAFLILSVLISVCVGYFLRKRFVYRSFNGVPPVCKIGTLVIVIICCIEFIFSNTVPLIDILLGRSQYGDFEGLPLVHTVLENSIIYFSAFTFYLFIETKNRSYLFQTIACDMMLLLMFHKGSLVFSLFAIGNLSLAKNKNKIKKHINMKALVTFVLFAIVLIYLNGVLSNLRSGVAWNSETLITSIGALNQRWPAWLPKEFGWTYTYIISPLANLNLNLALSSSNNFVRLVISVIPLFISKRIFPSLTDVNLYKLHTPVLNACTGYIESAYASGVIGTWFYFFIFIILLCITTKLRKVENSEYRSVYDSVLCVLSFFIFFYNTISSAATSLLIVLIIWNAYRKKVKFVLNARR